MTVTGLSQEPSREATLAALRARGKRGITVLDLDYRAMFWPSREEARAAVAEALPYVTVAVGNLDECDTAVGEREPARGRRRAARGGCRAGRRQAGPGKGVLASRRATRRTSRCRRCRSRW